MKIRIPFGQRAPEALGSCGVRVRQREPSLPHRKTARRFAASPEIAVCARQREARVHALAVRADMQFGNVLVAQPHPAAATPSPEAVVALQKDTGRIFPVSRGRR
jgi:hypothetical protein